MSPIAAGRMYPSLEHDAVRIDRLVVAPAFRGKQYDDLLLRVMLYKAQQMPFSAIEASVGEAERELLTGWVPARRIAANGARHCIFCAVQRRDLG